MIASTRRSSALDVYSIRIMLGLVASLGLVLGVVHLPLSSPVDRVGWSSIPPPDRIALREVQSGASIQGHSNEDNAPPPIHSRPAQSETGTDSPTASAQHPSETKQSQASDSVRASTPDVQSIAALAPEDQMPQIIGGMGTLYLNIEYPKEARDQGIEGTLELMFTIKTDGSVTNIEVQDSLHPLCDSAAVAGVRSVQFVPAKHNGTPVPIRMKLPVRFRLFSSQGAPKTADTNP